MQMTIRKTTAKDIDAVLKIFEDAKAYMLANGIDQWQKGYPNRETILRDIETSVGYVLTEGNEVLASAALFLGTPDPTYQKIYQGKWLSDAPYGTIHRVAVKKDQKGKRLASILMASLENTIREQGLASVRIDTHRDNLPMRRHLQKDGYQQCGIIHLLDGDERIAFEKLL